MAAQSGCIGATLAGTDGSYDTPDTELFEHAPVQAVTAGERLPGLIVVCQIADTLVDMFFTGMLDVAYAVHGVLSLTAVGNIADTVSLKLDGVNDIATFVPQPQYAFAQTPPADAFVTTWTVSAGQSITINFVGDDMDISWGDGATVTGVSVPQTHTYTDAGDYTVSVTGGLTGLTLDRPLDIFNNYHGPVPELASIDQWGNISWTNMSNAFAGASNMTYSATDTPDLRLVTDMSAMFQSTTAFDGDLSSWDVSPVTDMYAMFWGATAFDGDLSSWDVSSVTDMSFMFNAATSFNQPLSTWDVSSVTTMSTMFNAATSFNQPLSTWDVSSVTDMRSMFRSATSFNHDLNAWDVSSATYINEMFASAFAFNRPLNDWDVSSVNSTFNMFQGATSFNQPLNSWDVSAVTDMNDMFEGATFFNQPLNAWDVSSVTDMRSMFEDATDFNQSLNAWDVSSVITMKDMFLDATAFDQDLSGWYVVQDLPPVLTANAMFSIRAQNSYLDGLVSTYSVDDTRFVMGDKTLSLNSTNLPSAGMYPLDITAPAVLGEPDAGDEGHTRTLIVTVKGEHLPFITTWRTTLPSQVITINFVGSGMDISWGDGVTETNVSGSQTHTYADARDYTVSVTGALTGLTLDRPDVFDRPVGLVPELASIDKWGGISWTNMSNAFAGAANMTYMATDTPDLSLVTDMSYMFADASAFNGDISAWDVSSVTDMTSMFQSSTSFNQPLNTWDVSSVTDMTYMFGGASSFDQPLNDWDVSSVSDMGCMFFAATSFDQPLNDWDVSSVTDMPCMFYNAISFDQPLNAWDVSSVSDMNGMFHAAISFDRPLHNWDVSSVSDMNGMFHDALSFDQPLHNWDVSGVTDMTRMFGNADFFNQPLNAWDVSSVTGMDEMFDDATLFDQDLSNWYVTPDSAVLITDRSRTLTVMPLSPYIGEQSPAYTVSDAQFVMNGRTLSLNSANTPTAGIYNLTITATAVLYELNADTHTRTVTITVRDPPTASFITTWMTDSANQTITVPVGGSTARYSIDWGDNSPVRTGITGDSTHTYREPGIHIVSISGNFERIHLDGQQPNAGRLASIEQWGDMYWTSMSGAFDGAYNMVYNAVAAPDLGLVSDMSRMFAGATIFDGDISEWDVSTVRDMSGMFYSAAAFDGDISDWDVSAARNMNHMFARATSFDQPLNDWDVSAATDMGGMFTGASSFNHDLKAWDVSSATDMGGMFTGASSFNRDLSDWYVTLDGPAVIIPGYPRSPAVLPLSPYLDGRLHAYSVNDDNTQFVMDGRTILLADPDNPPTAGNYPLAITVAAVLGEPNTDSHTGNFEITIRAPVVKPFITVWKTSAHNQSVTIPGTGHGPVCNIDWGDGTDIENGVACHRTHTYAAPDNYRVSVSGGLERIGIDGRQPYADRLISIVQWGDTYWTSMRDAFRGASNMGYPATDTPNLSRVTGMSGMFAEASAFNGDISDWDVSSVRDMNRMFSRATSFDQPLDGWDVSKVTDMGGMFAVATSFNGNLSSWNVSSVITMRNMFYAASSFVQSLNDWDVSNVTDMYRMFSYSGIQHGLDKWDVSKVTNMHGMFHWAASFRFGDLSGWDVSSVTDMNSMFRDATSFNNDISGWDVSSVTDMTDMFSSSIFVYSFEQNLGRWYVTLDLDTIAGTGIPGVVGTISAQNQPLKNHSPTYVIVDGLDKNHFEIVSENRLNMTSGVSGKAEYSINVTASGTNVFESGNNWRVLVVRVSGDNNADLGGLTISSGTLSPQFSSSVTAYTASVDNSVTQVTVTPTASDSSATIAVNGNTVTSGNGYILTSLTAGEPTTVTVIVTAQDSTTKTYTITLTRAAALSDNADLTGLTISSGTLSPQFSSSDITYTASVANSVTQVTVTPTASDSSATIAVNGNTVTSGNGYILTSLTAGEPTTVTVIVTAQDSTTKTYTITLTRAAALSDNADLTGLTISSGTLSPQFSSSDITYTASVANSVTQVTVTPTASDSSATIAVNGNTVTSGNGYILTSLTAGEPTTVTVIVTAQDSTTKTYTITLTRAAALSDNADLTGLTISSGTLSPQFSSSDITYTASVANSVTQVTVTPTASDSSATIAVNGNTVTSGNGYILTSLTAGEPTTVTVIVTAQDSTTKTYTITLTRAAALSDNADLTGLTISSGTLSPQFSSSDITYTASVANSVTQVTVTPTASDSSATIAVNGNTVTSGNGYILTSLTVGGTNTITVIVTAQDSTTKTYTITLTRAAALSDNADLTGLTISSGTLSPQFSSSDITYTASVANSVTQVTVTPTASDSSATIAVNGNTVTSGNGYILTSLTAGEPTTVTVIVTAQDSTTKTYTITLTRAAALSDNADLTGLTISSGTLSPQFSSSDITYTASVANSVTQVTVTPTASDSSATIAVNGNTVTSGNGYILTSLTAGEPTTVTVIVTAQDSTTKTYTITLTRAAALSDNADLTGLTISSGTLSPQFSSSDITYTASVANSVTQVTVTPTASDSSATIAVNGNTVTSGNGYILTSLTAGEPTTVTVIVTAQDSTTKTYTITLTRAAALSDNADLTGLTISSGTLSPQFSSSDITYTASVANSVTQVTVTPTASDSSATIAVNGNTVTSGNGYILTSLTAGEPTTVTVIVTAQDSTTKTYTITLTRAAALSDNADLTGLTISSGTLSPQFSSSDITYTASVANSVTQVTVTPTASDSSATIAVNGNTVTSGNGYILTSLTAGEPTTVTVIVTAQDSTTKTYTITLTRAAALSDNADLTGLTISSGTLSPQFSSSDITYTASVANSVTQVTVTPTASDSSATIAVNGNTVTSGNGYILTSLTAGEPTTVTVIVTAQDSTTKTYTITLTRAAALSDNADLTGLTISSGTLSPQFSSSDITYTASVANSVTQVTVTPTASDSSATIAVNGNTVTSGNGYILTSLTAGGTNTITVIVTAQDSTTKTYTITLTRAAALSDNADLTGLTISSGTLSPQFSSSDITYTASVANSVTQVTVTPTASDSSATITVNDNTVTSGNGYILTSLTAGEPTTVTVIVTAQDSTTKTYTITLTRAAALSDNADLTGLTISSGTLSPQFSSSDITYTASVANSVTQVTVTPTASDSSATITVNGNTVTSGNGYILTSLTAGEPTTVTVIVTAQDSTTKTYTITLTRAAALSDNADLGGLTISSGTLSPQFSSSDITYTASVANSVTQVTVTPTASDSSATIAVNGNTVTSGNGYILTSLTAGEPTTVTVIVTAQDSTTKTYTITLTRAAALSDNADLGGLTISSGTLSPQFSSSVTAYTASVDNSVTQVTVTPTASHDSATIAVNGITVTSGTGHIVTGLIVGDTNTVTVTVTAQDSTTIKTYTVTVTVTGTPNTPIGDTSKKKSSSSKAPAVHINALAQARIIDIPPHIAEQVASHDASDPLEPITPDGTFDLPLVINGYGYLLDDVTNTLVSQTVTVGDGLTTITFTVYTQKDLAYFTLYLNLSDENIDYADSDTYITYKDDGTTSVTDPHGYIGSATVTVTQEDDQIPEKRTVRITIEFGEEPMGPTNMVAYMWNTDRKALFVKIINAFEVVAAPLEPVMQAADPEPAVPDSGLPADPEPVPRDTPWPDDYDDAQVLTLIRMWSGFESEFITDTQLLDLLGLEDYQDVDLPDWMMTELGVLVAKGDVTVGEFVLALQYVLTHA